METVSLLEIIAEIQCHRQLENVGFRRKGMSFFVGQYTGVYSLNHHITCRFEARQTLIYQLVLDLTGENDKYNYGTTDLIPQW